MKKKSDTREILAGERKLGATGYFIIITPNEPALFRARMIVLSLTRFRERDFIAF
jgi:hypothetical protein